MPSPCSPRCSCWAGWLLAARLLQGLATGIATSTVSAAMLDLNRERGSLINGIAPMIGMAIGALGTSALEWHLTPLFFAGTALSGVGFGASFNGAMRSLVPLATPLFRSTAA